MLAYLLTSGIALGAIYALIALGVVVLYRAAGVVNFAQGEQIMLAAYFAFSAHALFSFGYVPGAIIAVAGAAAIGLLIPAHHTRDSVRF